MVIIVVVVLVWKPGMLLKRQGMGSGWAHFRRAAASIDPENPNGAHSCSAPPRHSHWGDEGPWRFRPFVSTPIMFLVSNSYGTVAQKFKRGCALEQPLR